MIGYSTDMCITLRMLDHPPIPDKKNKKQNKAYISIQTEGLFRTKGSLVGYRCTCWSVKALIHAPPPSLPAPL